MKKTKKQAGEETTTKKKAKVKSAGTGARGLNQKPIQTGGGGGGPDRFAIFKIPQNADDVPVVFLDDEFTWIVYHCTKPLGNQYWDPHGVASPRDPDNPDDPSWLDEKIKKSARVREVFSYVRTGAAIPVWVPKGVPDKNGEKWYQEGGFKLLIVPTAQLKIFQKLQAKIESKGKSLVGAYVLASRGADKRSPAIGELWQYEKHVSPEFIEKKTKLPRKKWRYAVDYRKLFPPIDKAGFKKLLKQLRSGQAVSTDDDSHSSEDDGSEDVPWK